VHLDGARIFNAATALGDSVADMTRKVDSVMFCLSKGLGAPVGSMVVGSRAFIDKARVYRKMFGGGMRQAGVIAAAGLVALEKSPRRLHVDHKNAKRLAEGVAQIPGFVIDPARVRTNIVIFDCAKTGKTAVEWCELLYKRGVWAQDTALHSVRLVTHCDVDEAGIERALTVLQEVAATAQGVGA
jgi:threonine aldolase